MPSDGEVAGHLLLRLAERGDKDRRGATASSVLTKLELLLDRESTKPIPYAIQTAKSLPHRLGRKGVNFFSDGPSQSFIPLARVAKGKPLLPFVALKADATLSEFRLFLLMFMLTDKNRLRSLGFRFESPENPGSPGSHNYWHVQLTASFRQNGGLQHSTTPPWLPSSAPAFPLDANSASSCVLGLAVSLYGARVARDLVDELRGRISKDALDKLISDVKALHMGASPNK